VFGDEAGGEREERDAAEQQQVGDASYSPYDWGRSDVVQVVALWGSLSMFCWRVRDERIGGLGDFSFIATGQRSGRLQLND
jgi:hypothetical protein